MVIYSENICTTVELSHHWSIIIFSRCAHRYCDIWINDSFFDRIRYNMIDGSTTSLTLINTDRYSRSSSAFLTSFGTTLEHNALPTVHSSSLTVMYCRISQWRYADWYCLIEHSLAISSPVLCSYKKFMDLLRCSMLTLWQHDYLIGSF